MTLLELRRSQGLSQREVAERLGLTQPAVQKLEKTGKTTTDTLERYSHAIGCPWLTVCEALNESRHASKDN